MNMKKLLSRAKIVHEEIQRVWWDMGILVGDWLCHQCGKIWEDRSPKRCPDCESKYLEFMEVPLEKPEWNMRGRGDGILVIAAKLGLGEIKSINPYDFNVLTEPKQAHIFQCHCYMEMYKEPLNEAWIHYNERTNGRYKNFKIEKDPAVVEILDHNIKVLSECLEKKEPPELNYNEKVLYCNKRCMARKICKGE